MGAAVALTLVFVVVEAVCGWFAHSFALLSDAGHNLADAAAVPTRNSVLVGIIAVAADDE